MGLPQVRPDSGPCSALQWSGVGRQVAGCCQVCQCCLLARGCGDVAREISSLLLCAPACRTSLACAGRMDLMDAADKEDLEALAQALPL